MNVDAINLANPIADWGAILSGSDGLSQFLATAPATEESIIGFSSLFDLLSEELKSENLVADRNLPFLLERYQAEAGRGNFQAASLLLPRIARRLRNIDCYRFARAAHQVKLNLVFWSGGALNLLSSNKVARGAMPAVLYDAAATSVQRYSDGTRSVDRGMKAIAAVTIPATATTFFEDRGAWRDPLEEIRGLMKTKRYHKARVAIERFFKEEASGYDRELQAEAYSMLGSCFRHVGDFKSAIAYHQKAAGLARSQTQRFIADIERAMDWRAAGNLRRALFIIDHQVIDKLDGVEDMAVHSRAFRIKSLLLRELGDCETALRILKSLYRNGREPELTLREMAITFWMMGKKGEALAVLDRAIARDSEEEFSFLHSPRLRGNLILKAEMLWFSGKKSHAEQMITDLIVRLTEIDPAPSNLKDLLFPFFVQWIHFLENDRRTAQARGALKEAMSHGILEESLRRGVEGKKQGMFVKKRSTPSS